MRKFPLADSHKISMQAGRIPPIFYSRWLFVMWSTDVLVVQRWNKVIITDFSCATNEYLESRPDNS